MNKRRWERLEKKALKIEIITIVILSLIISIWCAYVWDPIDVWGEIQQDLIRTFIELFVGVIIGIGIVVFGFLIIHNGLIRLLGGIYKDG